MNQHEQLYNNRRIFYHGETRGVNTELHGGRLILFPSVSSVSSSFLRGYILLFFRFVRSRRGSWFVFLRQFNEGLGIWFFPEIVVYYNYKENSMTRISKIYRILISALLALLGFSCGNREREFVAEYGVPSATYKAKGVVVSEADESFHIEGIQAELKGDAFHWTPPAVSTNSDGSFSLSGNGFPMSDQKLYVQLIDVDGEENGLFAEMEIEADYTNKPFIGGDGHWYSGQAEVDLGTIKMKPKDKD